MDNKGNFIAEWFGHRIYPSVTSSAETLHDQKSHRCHFLSQATNEDRPCVKSSSSLGVCTISSSSNGNRQDWLVCPYRALETDLLEDVTSRLFGSSAPIPRLIIPAPALSQTEIRSKVAALCEKGETIVVYLQDKLGGEISISRTERSPELSFDITLAELKMTREMAHIERYGILEVQTMDFHGSYRHAVKNLRDALRLHDLQFPKALGNNKEWAGERIEGPNISNVFKRTFYQMMLKFRIGQREPCAGTVLAIPRAVWDSWQRHLGSPRLEAYEGDTFRLRWSNRESEDKKAAPASTWIYVFDIASDSSTTPNPIQISHRIATDAATIAHFALEVAPEYASQRAAELVPLQIRQRLARWWPGIWDQTSSAE